MDTSRVLSLLELLQSETSGQSELIAQLYKRALDENDDVIWIQSLLDRHFFYNEIGGSLQKKADRLQRSLYEYPERSLESLPAIRQVAEIIEHEAKISDDLMRSPTVFSEAITVIPKNHFAGNLEALGLIARTCVYLLALYGGDSALEGLSWDDSAGIQDKVYAVNTKFLPALSRVYSPAYGWVITKQQMGGNTLLGGDGFSLKFEPKSKIEMFCDGYNGEPMGTHVYLNIDAFESGETDVPYCWGIGNFLSRTPRDAFALLERRLVTRLRCPSESELSRRMPRPDECVTLLADGGDYCITPDELVLAMNRWQVGHEAAERKQMHCCLICGKHVDRGLVACSSHYLQR